MWKIGLAAIAQTAVEAEVVWKIEKKNECRIQQGPSETAKVIEQFGCWGR